MDKANTFLILILIGLALQYCSNTQDHSVACTDEFVMLSVTVLHPDGTPADSVQTEVKKRESGTLYEICVENYCRSGDNGNYTIMHDGFWGEISKNREAVLVEGTKDNLQFSKEYAFRSGECHVEKIGGPDTVSLSMN